MSQSGTEDQGIKRPSIGWPEISLKRYGGVIHRAYVRDALSKDFDVELISLEAKRLKRFRYLKMLESFFYYLMLKGQKDLWIRDYYSTVTFNPKRTKGKNLVWIHHLDFSGYPAISQPFFNFLNKYFFFPNIKKADFVVTMSEYWRKYFSDLGCKNVYKIYGGFELDKYNVSDEEAAQFKKEKGIEGKPIIYLGNCQKAKGVVDSYNALKDLDVILVTSGEKHVDIPALNLNLDYRGYLKLIKSASIVLTMSKFKEGWCRTAHEAMLFKTPVIGSGSGGMTELLEGGGQIICPDFKDLRKRVEYLLANLDARKEMGEKGYAFAKNFSIEETKKNWLDLIKNLMQSNEALQQVPLGDKGVSGERDDMLHPQKSGRRGVYEHLQRYRLAAKQIGSGKKVLDLGCGTGYGSFMLYDHGNEVTGTDISSDAIAYAQKKYSGPHYICCPAENIVAGNDYYDAVTSFEVIEHVQEAKKVLKEICRVLKSGGDLFISTPNPRHFSNAVKHFLLGRPYPEKVVAGNIYHIKEFYYDELLDLLKKENLEIISGYGQTLTVLPVKVEALLGKFPLLYKMPILLGYTTPKYAWTVVVHARKK